MYTAMQSKINKYELEQKDFVDTLQKTVLSVYEKNKTLKENFEKRIYEKEKTIEELKTAIKELENEKPKNDHLNEIQSLKEKAETLQM